jgi:hypothetical protein
MGGYTSKCEKKSKSLHPNVDFPNLLAIDNIQHVFYSTFLPSLKYSIHQYSNGNASETKANESFDNGVFFDIEAKRTPSTVRKLFSKRSEHIR